MQPPSLGCPHLGQFSQARTEGDFVYASAVTREARPGFTLCPESSASVYLLSTAFSGRPGQEREARRVPEEANFLEQQESFGK